MRPVSERAGRLVAVESGPDGFLPSSLVLALIIDRQNSRGGAGERSVAMGDEAQRASAGARRGERP